MDRSRSGQPYSQEELEKIEWIAFDRNTREDLARMFPGRSPSSIRTVMWQMRDRSGTARKKRIARDIEEPETPMLNPDDPGITSNWPERNRRDMAKANLRFLDALERA